MHRLLEATGLRNRERALANLSAFLPQLSPDLQARLLSLIANCPDPDSALHYMARFASVNPPEFQRLMANPALISSFVTVFAQSKFLSEEILLNSAWVEQAVTDRDFHRMLFPEEMELRLEEFLLKHGSGVPSALHLAQFRRQQILRILLRDVTGVCNLAETTEELSNLADAILHVTFRHIRDELTKRHGPPCYLDEAGFVRQCEFSVIALGKLGGQELNYSSDIDLMFVYSANGETSGERSISNKEFYKKAAAQYTELLSTYTAEGMCYRVDLRLRPEGTLGELCISTQGAKNYYRNRARDWELQMLIKARVAAGDRAPGRELLDFVQPLIYSSTLDFSAVEAVSQTRERIQEKLQHRKTSAKEIDIKLARGGIRDIEFLVQCLQRLHGGREPWVRHGGTLLALFRLRDKHLLSDVEYSRLCSAYEFLRHLEHRLQFEEDRQTHTLPQSREALQVLARRMPVQEIGSQPTAARLMSRLNEYLDDVREIYERVIHAQQPMYYTTPDPAPEPSPASEPDHPHARMDGLEGNLIRFLDQRAPALAATLAHTNLKRGAKAFARYLEWVVPNPEWLQWLDSDSVLTGYIADLFEHSIFFSEQLMSHPDLIGELRKIRQHPGRDATIEEALTIDDANDLRRFFRREMFRIQAESVCLGSNVFHTLMRTSTLADIAIQCAYRLSIEEVAQSSDTLAPGYVPKDQMMVIALGRLGMREFDLGSDADLIFVLPDSDAAELQFWTRVAAKIIDRLSAYTREGFMFTVDTRLRPNGREGELVQLASSYESYFASRAEAWEGITYMKSRAVAGNLDNGTRFLNAIQELDWRRYGQSGRSQMQLRQMRLRLEKEQGAENPLKAGEGGYYDIDFALMYLRLKGAGIFYPVLNTPERIDIIEKMGHLERSDAAFLRDAATFYRALDHGLRLLTGQAEGTLPKSQAQLEMLTGLVTRWTPDHLHDQPLEDELAQVRHRTREFFDRVFAA